LTLNIGLNMEKNEINVAVDKTEQLYYGVGNFLWEVVKVFFWALVIIMPIRIFLFQPFFVQGASMEPNFDDGDYLIVNELGYKKTTVGTGFADFFTVTPFKELERGDIVVFKYPKNPQQYFIKRIIALPGEKIQISAGKVIIFNSQNPEGLALDESYLSEGLETTPEIARTLSDSEYFVMGDNRKASHDSRAWGPLPKDMVIGKVLLRAWPVNKANIF